MNDRIFVDWVSELKDKADIVDIISSYIPLSKQGRSYWACCPFHHEKTPSFAINREGKYYHCFGCGVSGDVINFIAEYENVEFLEACKILADKVGYKIPEFNDDPVIKKNINEKDEIYKVLRDTAVFYNKNLSKESAKPAINYLAKRGFDGDLVTRFGIGYSADYDSLPKYLKLKNYTDDIILKSNVCGKNVEGKLYDALGGRLIIPIINVQNKVIAFGGRVLEKSSVQNKYKNTANSPVFIKNKNLFGINIVNKLKQRENIDSLIMVEGYMDVIALNKAGFSNVVASMGTSLTTGQATLVKRFTDVVYVAYDGDKAGQMATLRSLDIFASQGLKVKVIKLDEGLDPDEIINQKGKQHFIDLMLNATPLIDYKLQVIEQSYNLDNPDGRANYAKAAVKMLAEIKEPEVREVYLDVVTQKAKIQRHRLPNTENNQEIHTNNIEKTVKIEKDNGYLKACRIILSNMLNHKPYAVFTDISTYLKNDTHKKIFDYIKKCHEENKQIVTGNLFDIVPEDDELSAVINYNFENKETEWEQAEYKQSLNTLKISFVQDKIEELMQQIKSVTDIDTKRNLTQQINKLQMELMKYKKER